MAVRQQKQRHCQQRHRFQALPWHVWHSADGLLGDLFTENWIKPIGDESKPIMDVMPPHD